MFQLIQELSSRKIDLQQQQETLSSHSTSALQRLTWASGANHALQPVHQKFKIKHMEQQERVKVSPFYELKYLYVCIFYQIDAW